jgi:hypothetical protein
MRPCARLIFALLSSFTALACHAPHDLGGGGAGGGAGGASPGLPCDVDAVLAASCRSCHGATPQFGAPMPLVTHADLIAPARSDPSRKVYELVGQRTHDDTSPMPQAPNPRLDAAAQKTLDDWIAAGAPASTGSSPASCGGTGGAGGGPALGCTPDRHLVPTTAYTIPKDTTDAYICYGIDVTEAQKRHITAFAPHLDNTAIVHHIVLFQSDTAVAAGPAQCSLGGAVDWRIVSVWAPGGEGFVLPPEAGFPMEGTTHYVIQVHYNNLSHLEGQSDHSGFDLCTTTDLRPNDADVLAFGSMAFTIPAHGALDLTCNFKIPAALPDTHVIAAMPHMHKLGRLMSTVTKPGGADLGHRDPWDFNTQYWTPLDQTLSAGDVVSTRCAFDNPGDAAVTWGENTEDEMCWSFTMYYPKVTAPQWKWTIPSATAKCSPTP